MEICMRPIKRCAAKKNPSSIYILGNNLRISVRLSRSSRNRKASTSAFFVFFVGTVGYVSGRRYVEGKVLANFLHVLESFAARGHVSYFNWLNCSNRSPLDLFLFD